jgi:hypothetical protein
MDNMGATDPRGRESCLATADNLDAPRSGAAGIARAQSPSDRDGRREWSSADGAPAPSFRSSRPDRLVPLDAQAGIHKHHRFRNAPRYLYSAAFMAFAGDNLLVALVAAFLLRIFIDVFAY